MPRERVKKRHQGTQPAVQSMPHPGQTPDVEQFLSSTEDSSAAALQTWSQLPPADLTRAFVDWSLTHPDAALERLSVLAGSNSDVVAASAAEALVELRSAAAASALQQLAEQAPTRAARKAARRGLFRLQSLGVTHTDLPAPPAPEQGRATLIARVSNPDGAGERLLVLAVAAPLGSADLVTCVASDQVGLQDCRGARFSRAELTRRVQDLLRANEGLHLVDAPPDYVRHAAVHAHNLNRSGGHPVPEEFYRWAPLLTVAELRDEREPVYDVVNAALLRWSPQLTDESGELLHLPEFMDWLIPPEHVEEALRRQARARENRLIMPGDWLDQGENRVVDQLADGYFTAERRLLYKQRLEQASYVLHQVGRVLDARLALAAALALDPATRTPASRVPFATELALHTLQMLQAEVERQRTRGGGLILP